MLTSWVGWGGGSPRHCLLLLQLLLASLHNPTKIPLILLPTANQIVEAP